MPQWSEMTALFGGRFDPPHLGHIEAVAGLFETPGAKQVRILISPTPAYKPAVASVDHRLAMARLAMGGRFPGDWVIDLREMDRARLNPSAPTYSFDTLSEMKGEFGDRLAFVIGTDQLQDLRKWHRFPEILGLCHWIVLARKPNGDHLGRTALSEWEASGLAKRATDHEWRLSQGSTFLTLVPTPARACSSTAIREAIARTGLPPENQLSEPVSAYLKKQGLYGSTPSSTIR